MLTWTHAFVISKPTPCAKPELSLDRHFDLSYLSRQKTEFHGMWDKWRIATINV